LDEFLLYLGNLTKIVKFCFTISAHNEQVFSVMQIKWLRERNRLPAESMTGILTLKVSLRLCHVNGFMLTYVAFLGF
jgi:hypothetical protein